MTDTRLPNVGDCVRLQGGDFPKGIAKYCGDIAGSSGTWIGVDWDDAKRGKHDGSVKGHRYFQARSETSGSFVRPSALSLGSDLVEEVIRKYVSDPVSNTNVDRWELILEDVYEKQKDILALACIALTNTNVSHIRQSADDFRRCSDLDLSGTLLSKWTDLVEILMHFPVLRTLHLNNTRMEPLPSMSLEWPPLPPVTQISMRGAFLTTETANNLTRIFTNLEEIHLEANELVTYAPVGCVDRIRTIDLQRNPISSISQIDAIKTLPKLELLNLSDCGLSDIRFEEGSTAFPQLRVLHAQNNAIDQWTVVDELAKFPRLDNLILRDNHLPSVAGLDVRDLIISKLPKMAFLDRCDVSEVERRSIERYVLKRLSESGTTDPSHLATIRRLEQFHGISYDIGGGNDSKSAARPNAHLANSRKIYLHYKSRRVQRVLSLQLSIHRLVGVASRVLDFEPDEIVEVALNRADVDVAERLRRTSDSLLSNFNLNDGDSIVFLSDECSRINLDSLN